MVINGRLMQASASQRPPGAVPGLPRGRKDPPYRIVSRGLNSQECWLCPAGSAECVQTVDFLPDVRLPLRIDLSG